MMENEQKYSTVPEKMSATRVDQILKEFKERFDAKGYELDHDQEYFIVRSHVSGQGPEYHIPKAEYIPQKNGPDVKITKDLEKLLNSLEAEK